MTTFVLRGTGPKDFQIKSRTISNNRESKTKYDIINPGKVSHVNSAGNAIRVMRRGGLLNKDGNPYNRDCGKPCFWHRMTFDGLAMGLPIRISNNINAHITSNSNQSETDKTIEDKAIIHKQTSENNHDNSAHNNHNNHSGHDASLEPDQCLKDVVYMDLVFCSYSCAYAYIFDQNETKIKSARDPNYAQSKVLLEQLFDMEFPGEKLTPARDWKLLKTVGNGTMSVKEFLTGIKGIRLAQNPNYQYLPVTVTYDILK